MINVLHRDGTRDVRPTQSPPTPAVPDPAAPTVGEIMSDDVTCVHADVLVEDAARVLDEQLIGAVPVVDDAFRPIGVLSKTDIVRIEAHSDRPAPAIVRRVMTPLTRTLPPTAPLWEAAAVMGYESFHHIVVIDSRSTVIGILSSLDIVKWFARREGWPSHKR